MPRERILITVKTYPTLSNKYAEVVCTAGFREDGTWVRIYPIKFRQMDDFHKYKKFQWIEVDIKRNNSDARHESYRPVSEITTLETIGTKNNWQERRQFVLDNTPVYDDFSKLLDDNRCKDGPSLATFKPTVIHDFIAEEDEREWDKEKQHAIESMLRQTDLFQETPKDFHVVNKLPYKFKYIFSDITGKRRTLTVSDWETGALYWNEIKRFGGDEAKAVESVRNKYLKDVIIDRDTHFFLGTTQSWDAMNAPNPFMIVGVFYPPLDHQQTLF